jgi:hypothetical protein
MKKVCLYIIIIAISLFYYNGNAQNTKPEKIYSIVKVDKPCSWFQEQSELWKKETNKNPKDANAWYNYYKAMRYVKILSDTNFLSGLDLDKELNNIIKQMEAKVPNSYEFNLLKFQQGGMDLALFPYLKKAYDMYPDRIDTYSDLAAYYEGVRDTSNLKTIMIKWYKSNDFSPGIMALNYNELQSLEKNAIILVWGDNMYYPKKALQYALGIRNDVKVVLAGFLSIPSYRDCIFKELDIELFKKQFTNFNDGISYSQAIIEYITQNVNDRSIYFSSALETYFFEKIKDYLYSEGLVYKYSAEKYDNIAIIKRNYEKNYLKDYLSYNFTNDVSQSIVDYSNLNYIPAFLTLYEHYKLFGDNDKANEIKTTIYHIAKKVENNEEYLKLIKEKIGE